MIEVELTDGILHVQLNRPDKKNALSSQMYRDLTASFQRASEDDSIRVVLLSGYPGSFSAGNDLADFVQAGTLDNDHPTVQFLHALSQFEKPLLAAVDGLAIGIGTTALLHCDLVYATAGSRFQMPFTALGLCPESASSVLLPQLVGYQRAAQYLLLGEPFDGQTALQMGLVNQLAEPEDLKALALQKARQVAALPQHAARHTKALLKQSQKQLVQHVLHQELAVFEQLLHSDECQSALARFFKK